MKIPLALIFLIIVAACSKNENSTGQMTNGDDLPVQETIEIPSSNLDYNAMENWAIHPEKQTLFSSAYYQNLNISVVDENLNKVDEIEIPNNSKINTGVDVFFVHPTSTVGSEHSKTPQNVAIEDQDGPYIAGLVIAQGGLLAKYGRLFSPRYRESSGATFNNEDLSDKDQAEIIAVSYSDIKTAFLDYLQNYNNGNKIILAGHSQGSFLLGMLLRDVFDEDPSLQNKLLTAALGGMGYLFAEKGTYKGGWWKNIALCQTTNECGCVQTWRSYSESFSINDVNYTLHQFNPYLVNNGLVYREFDIDKDWFIQDSSYYTNDFNPLEYYITPNAGDYTELNIDNRFLAFDGMYTAKFQRDNDLVVGLRVKDIQSESDLRTNELRRLPFEDPNYLYWGYHTKDYHIYTWALLQQIDQKLSSCN